MKCFIFNHNWSKWKDTSTGHILRIKDDTKIGGYIQQESRCKKCNKVRLNMVKTQLLNSY